MIQTNNSGTCTANISFSGIPFPIRAEIDDETASLLETWLLQNLPEDPEHLIQIRDIYGRHLILNTTYINKLILVDWIRPSAQNIAKGQQLGDNDPFDPDSDLEDYPSALRIYFADGKKPVSHIEVSGLEMDNMRFLLDTYLLKNVPMFSFYDEDNDLTFVNPRNIVFLEYHDVRIVNNFLESDNVDFFYSDKK